MGRSFQENFGRRTSGHKIKQAKAARQNASRGPDQPLRNGDFTKNPLVLHSTAATTTSIRACGVDGEAARPRSAEESAASAPSVAVVCIGCAACDWNSARLNR